MFRADKIFKIFLKGGGLKVLDLACVTIIGIILARYLGVYEYGVYTSIVAVIYLASSLIQFGLPNFLLREVSGKHARGHNSEILSVWTAALKIFLSFSLLGIIIVFLVLEFFYTNIAFTAILISVLLVPALAFTHLVSSFLRGLGLQLSGLTPVLVIRPLGFLLLLIGFNHLFGLSAVTSISLLLLSFMFAILVALLLLVKNYPEKGVQSEHNVIQLKLLIPIALLGGLQIVFHKVDILTVSFFLSPEEVGTYKVASQVANVVGIPLMIVRLTMGPSLARLFATSRHNDLARVFQISKVLAFLCAFPLMLLIFFYNEDLVLFLFGEDYLALGTGALLVLCLGQTLLAFFGPLGQLLLMTKNESLSVKWLWKALMINGMLNIGAILSGFGIMGIAIATVAATLFLIFGFKTEVKKKFGF